MVIALLGLGLVMIVGGIAAVVQGFPYVRLESGLAMVISGTSAASAGAILLGVAAVVARLKGIEQAVRSAGSRSASEHLSREFVPLSATSAAAPPGEAGMTLGAIGAAGRHASLDEPGAVSEIHLDPGDRITRTSPDIEPTLPHLLPASEGKTDAAGSAPASAAQFVPTEPEANLFPGPPSAVHGSDEHEALALRPSLGDLPREMSQTEPPSADGTPGEASGAGALQVVGTYASGGNTYVMYANGSIEADTPRGRFNFDSLDELKAFVEAGGENARGAA